MGVTLSFVKASTIACSWNFYAGKGAWLLINCNGAITTSWTISWQIRNLLPSPPCPATRRRRKRSSRARPRRRFECWKKRRPFSCRRSRRTSEPGDRIADHPQPGGGAAALLLFLLLLCSAGSAAGGCGVRGCCFVHFLPRCHNPSCGGLCPRRPTCSKCKRARGARECQRDSWPAHRRASVRERHGQMHEHRACVEPSVRAKHNAARWARWRIPRRRFRQLSQPEQNPREREGA